MKRIAVLLRNILQTLLDLLAAILGIYYTTKYAALARRLGLPRLTPAGRRGFIVIQIDGLSCDHLRTAMARGYAPHLSRLLRRGEFSLQPWRVGLPSNTPAAQAGIMFGENADIPAFRWYEKRSGQTMVCSLPGVVHAIQERLSHSARGILRGGSSYMNLFDGDASLALFTLSAWNRQRFFERVRGLGFLLLFLLNPFRTVKTFVLAVWEYLTDLAQRSWATWRKRTPRPFGRAFPFMRVVSNVILREIQTFAVLLDIYRGVPAIYTTYYGYDEVAHQYGDLSKPALRALRAIDARIRQIDTFRRLMLTRAYDLLILSDHGMTSARPFRTLFGESLGDLLRGLAGESIALYEGLGATYHEVLQAVYVQGELEAIAGNLRPPLDRIPRRLKAFIGRRAVLGEEPPPDMARATDLVVRNSGPLSHVYFNLREGPMDLNELLIYYPSLVTGLLAHPGIGWVAARQDGQVVIMSGRGIRILSSGGDPSGGVVEGEDPLASLEDPRWAARQIARVAGFANAGDLILMGHYDPEKKSIVCFEEQWACHGGLGGPQDQAFLMAPADLGWDVTGVEQATDIYPLFMGRYGEGVPIPALEEVSAPCSNPS